MAEPLTGQEILRACQPGIIRDFLDYYGRVFTPQPLPRNYRQGAWGCCFANSYKMAKRHRVVYVEGYAISAASRSAHLHAWCADGEYVLDRTWADGVGYFGVPIRWEFLNDEIQERERRNRETGAEMYYGLLDDYRNGWPLVKKLADQPEQWSFDQQLWNQIEQEGLNQHRRQTTVAGGETTNGEATKQGGQDSGRAGGQPRRQRTGSS